jgi:hypothetical protein
MIHKLYKCTDKYKNLERIARKRYKKDEFNHIYDLFHDAFFLLVFTFMIFFTIMSLQTKSLKKDSP